MTKAATVLLEALSELCSKCSDEMMVQLLDFLKKLYSSPQKDHYLQAASLVKRLIPFYPVGLHRELLLQLLTFPLPNLERLRIHRDLLDPFGVLLARSKGFKVESEKSCQEIEQLIILSQSHDNGLSALNRLLYCGEQGLLIRKNGWEILSGRMGNHIFLKIGWILFACISRPSVRETKFNTFVSLLQIRLRKTHLG